jgi:hypothetical protein
VNPPTRLLAAAASTEQAARARADGADLIDVRMATPGALASIRASLPAAVLWTGPAGTGTGQAEPFDADRLASTPAALAAAAAIGTWLGRPVIRSQHTRAARRAIDMTLVITGARHPARTLRGLA